MKKALFLILALILCLSLCACGENVVTPDNGGQQQKPDTAAIDKVVDMIDALEVSLTSGKSITAAEKAYAALTAEQKSAVTNYDSLVEARASYDRILNVFTLIEEIGSVTKESEPAIIAAENAYKALSIEERIAITNSSTLTAARATFDAIPTEVTLTVENVEDYFTLEETNSITKEKLYGMYASRIVGSVVAKQKVTLESIENVTLTVRVTCSVGRDVDSSIDSEKTYKTYEYDVEISVSATTGAGSGSYKTDGNYVNDYWYPSIEVVSVKAIAVTGTVTID